MDSIQKVQVLTENRKQWKGNWIGNDSKTELIYNICFIKESIKVSGGRGIEVNKGS